MDAKARKLIVWVAQNARDKKVDANSLINFIGLEWDLNGEDVRSLIEQVKQAEGIEPEPTTDYPTIG